MIWHHGFIPGALVAEARRIAAAVGIRIFIRRHGTDEHAVSIDCRDRNAVDLFADALAVARSRERRFAGTSRTREG